MVIITFSHYPTDILQQVAEKFNALPPLPDHMKIQGPYGHFSETDGWRSILIYEFEESKMAEAARIIGVRLAAYNDIPGFRVEAKVCTSPGDAEIAAQMRAAS